MDHLETLECTGPGSCDNVRVSNIQDGGTITCRGGDSCSDSEFSVAVGASYTHICDNSPPYPEHSCGACEATGFNVEMSNGNDNDNTNGKLTLISGRGEGTCAVLQFSSPLNLDNNNPQLCIICAFPGSCLWFEDDVGGEAFTDSSNVNATTYGGGCVPADMERLCRFYQDIDEEYAEDTDNDSHFLIDLDDDGLNDCNPYQDNEHHANSNGNGHAIIPRDGPQEEPPSATIPGEAEIILEEEEQQQAGDGDEVAS